jgi:hypothetical protein
MDQANAFIGKTERPTADEIAAALGPVAKIWDALIHGLDEEYGVNIQEWKSYSAKSGWALQLKLKKRTIVYLAPCNKCFRVAFVLGDKAVTAAKQHHLPTAVKNAIKDAPHYPEGTGLRLLVKAGRDLPAIQKIVEIKLAN